MQKLLLISSFLLAFQGYTQELTLEDYNRRMYNYNKGGWLVVGGSATVGLGIGIVGILTTKDLQTKHFHQMNIMANVSHLSFAIPGYIAANRKDPSSFNEKDTYQHNIRHEHAYLFNAGLDVVYATTGWRLKQLGNVNPNYPELLHGYGNALLIHGIALFCVDMTMTFLHIMHRKKQFDPNIEFSSGPNGIGFKWKL